MNATGALIAWLFVHVYKLFCWMCTKCITQCCCCVTQSWMCPMNATQCNTYIMLLSCSGKQESALPVMAQRRPCFSHGLVLIGSVQEQSFSVPINTMLQECADVTTDVDTIEGPFRRRNKVVTWGCNSFATNLSPNTLLCVCLPWGLCDEKSSRSWEKDSHKLWQSRVYKNRDYEYRKIPVRSALGRALAQRATPFVTKWQ